MDHTQNPRSRTCSAVSYHFKSFLPTDGNFRVRGVAMKFPE